MTWVEPAVVKALGDVLQVGLCALVWLAARSAATADLPGTRRPLTAYGRVLLVCAFLALGCWSTYGTHAEDPDPINGGGERIVDFVPTDAERNEYGLKIFLTIAAVALHGTWYGRKHRSDVTAPRTGGS
jgi:hypothetical protein